MSDATDRIAALALLTEYLQPTVEPTLSSPAGEVGEILDRNKRGSRWSATSYVYGDVVFPTVRNGHRYMVITAGTAVTEPSWPTGLGSTITSGAEFQEAGTDYANVYDVRRAAYEGWRLKAHKASQFINTGDLSFTSVFEHCVQMSDKFLGVVIA